MSSMDILGMALWYLKGESSAYKLCTVYVWLDFALNVLVRTVIQPSLKDFEIRCLQKKM